MAHLSDETRLTILAAASGLFAERSFDKVRMEDVAQAAVVGKVTIYRYFPTKDDLFCKLLEGIGKEFLAKLREAEASVRGCRVRLVVILKEAQAFFAARPFLLDLLDRARLDPDLRKKFPWVDVQQQLFRTLQGLLAEGVARKEFEVDELEVAVRALIGAMRTQLIIPCEEVKPEEFSEHVVKMVIRPRSAA